MREMSMLDFALHMAAAEVAWRGAKHRALEKASRVIEDAAKAEIGHYQPQVGPFPAWAPLAESTEQHKAAMGYPAGAPLLATGDMRENISHQVEGNEAAVGSPDDRAVYHEFGTSRMPPRPIFGPAVFRNEERIQRILGGAIVEGVLHGEIAAGGGEYLLGR